jgi:autotransporter-associated beta strand protein
MTSGGALAGGIGGLSASGADDGLAFGSGFFLQATTVTFGNGDYTILDDIADQDGSGGAAASNGIGGTGGSGGITKAGTGTLTLAGSNTYTGATTVDDGTVLVTGTIANSAVVVLSGGRLAGDGVTGAISVTAGGRLAPGANLGDLQAGSISLIAGASLDIELAGTNAGTQYDQLRITGTVSLGGANLDVASLAFTAAQGDSFMIIDNDGVDAVVGQFAQGTQLTVNGRTFAIDYAGGNGNDVVLTALAAPGPGTGGPDVLIGDDNPNDLSGFGGNDRIEGRGGNDTLDGGDDNDVVLGEGGNDQISGGNGDDILNGGDGNDAVNGGAGNDRMVGRSGNDTLDGGDGADQLFGEADLEIRVHGALTGADIIL